MDPILVEVVRNHLISTADEMKERVMQSAMASVWRESGDLSCAVLTPTGDVVAQGTVDLPCHLGTMPFSTKGALQAHPLESLRPGDVLFHNDPRFGNNHLPDCIMLMPVFSGEEVLAIAAVRGHWTDIGGVAAGSYTTATTELLQEGLLIPPVKIIREGRVDNDLLSLILANVRLQEQARGDFWAQFSGCRLGADRVEWLIGRYGSETLARVMRDILELSEQLTRQEIAKWPSRTVVSQDTCDGDGVSQRSFRIAVSLTVNGDSLLVDFSGTDGAATGGINAPYATTASAVYFAVKAVADPWNPANSGSYRPIEVRAPEGTIVNAPAGSPVVASNHETANVIADVVLRALAEVVPERVCAAGSGSAVVTMITGRDHRRAHRPFAYLEPHGGAMGARPQADGENAVRVGVGNTGNQPIEVVEEEFPVRITRYELVADGGGPGRQRGGIPALREYEFLSDAMLTITAERGVTRPYGLFGGMPGPCAVFELIHADGRRERLPCKTPPIAVSHGSTLRVIPAGGGGYGLPTERSPDLLARDVRDGLVSSPLTYATAKRDIRSMTADAGGGPTTPEGEGHHE